MDYLELIKKLPYSKPFLFVDDLISVSDEGVQGSYTFREDESFYQGHFKDFPVTPGVILTECCAQIGLVPLGIYLLQDQVQKGQMAMSSSDMEFYLPVFPGDKVEVHSEKIYFRFGKLKCRVKMYNSTGAMICKGEISGMLKTDSNEQ